MIEFLPFIVISWAVSMIINMLYMFDESPDVPEFLFVVLTFCPIVNVIFTVFICIVGFIKYFKKLLP